ncbi:transporter substrate-binding domain-containing protein [uncultured Methanospirillum sp.]|uniref:transporter substrate-binding domain-containing protein n=1 Tax=uncultured Methanospirillum sp. TaxID=262503 RepID=UPI0029C7E677|nr:transporter substrate-binding domain-containing protein [uncultured Methanospirillum sp.]
MNDHDLVSGSIQKRSPGLMSSGYWYVFGVLSYFFSYTDDRIREKMWLNYKGEKQFTHDMDGKLILAILALLILPAGGFAAPIPDDLQILTEDNAPLNYIENGTLQGITVDMMEEILNRMGSNLTRDSFKVISWNDAYTQISNNPDTMILAMDRLPEREDQFLWAGPVITVPQVLFVRTDSNLSDETDIGALRIVTITDDCGKTYAINAGADESNIVEVPSTGDAVRMVENGSVDAWVYNELAGMKAIDQFAKDPNTFGMGKELGSSRVYYAFNRGTSPAFVQEVNATIQSLKRDRSETGVTGYEHIISRYIGVQCSFNSTGKEKVIDLVNKTAIALSSDAPGTIADINAGKAPYRDPTDPELYAFVFDKNVTLLANSVNSANNGKNLSGTTDVTGKAFRDDMVDGAVRNGTGWVSYVYSNPDSLGLYQKMSYYQLVNGSDGISYIVGAGRYVSCDEVTSPES